MQAAAQALDVHNAASSWSKALLDNAARPSGAIVHSGQDGNGGLSQEQFERLQFELESYHQGARNAGRPMLLEGGLDWKPMGFSPSEMEFTTTSPQVVISTAQITTHDLDLQDRHTSIEVSQISNAYGPGIAAVLEIG